MLIKLFKWKRKYKINLERNCQNLYIHHLNFCSKHDLFDLNLMESLQTTFEPTFDKGMILSYFFQFSILMRVVSEKENFPAAEEKHLNYWKEIDAFKKQLKLTENDPPYSFYDGPPFATGLPHYGNLLAGTVKVSILHSYSYCNSKDICTRYASQNGFHVARRFGWDCHGLPIEYEIDKKLQIKGHEDYEKVRNIINYNSG